MPSSTVEDYVKAIHLIADRAGTDRPVETGEIAAALGVSSSTVTRRLQSLARSKLVFYTPNKGARLTGAGQRLALRVLRRHRRWELFLARVLGLSWDEVHAEAEHLEHAASERLINRIDAYLGHPTIDPHDDPVPGADGGP